jgi:hypothetical protein
VLVYLLFHAVESVLNDFTHIHVPNHVLELKVGDICLILRCMKGSELASNTRVQILAIHSKCIRVVTLDKRRLVVLVPRMRFKFGLKNGLSFKMMR